jgi:hypothetical protein
MSNAEEITSRRVREQLKLYQRDNATGPGRDVQEVCTGADTDTDTQRGLTRLLDPESLFVARDDRRVSNNPTEENATRTVLLVDEQDNTRIVSQSPVPPENSDDDTHLREPTSAEYNGIISDLVDMRIRKEFGSKGILNKELLRKEPGRKAEESKDRVDVNGAYKHVYESLSFETDEADDAPTQSIDAAWQQLPDKLFEQQKNIQKAKLIMHIRDNGKYSINRLDVQNLLLIDNRFEKVLKDLSLESGLSPTDNWLRAKQTFDHLLPQNSDSLRQLHRHMDQIAELQREIDEMRDGDAPDGDPVKNKYSERIKYCDVQLDCMLQLTDVLRSRVLTAHAAGGEDAQKPGMLTIAKLKKLEGYKLLMESSLQQKKVRKKYDQRWTTIQKNFGSDVVTGEDLQWHGNEYFNYIDGDVPKSLKAAMEECNKLYNLPIPIALEAEQEKRKMEWYNARRIVEHERNKAEFQAAKLLKMLSGLQNRLKDVNDTLKHRVRTGPSPLTVTDPLLNNSVLNDIKAQQIAQNVEIENCAQTRELQTLLKEQLRLSQEIQWMQRLLGRTEVAEDMKSSDLLKTYANYENGLAKRKDAHERSAPDCKDILENIEQYRKKYKELEAKIEDINVANTEQTKTIQAYQDKHIESIKENRKRFTAELDALVCSDVGLDELEQNVEQAKDSLRKAERQMDSFTPEMLLKAERQMDSFIPEMLKSISTVHVSIADDVAMMEKDKLAPLWRLMNKEAIKDDGKQMTMETVYTLNETCAQIEADEEMDSQPPNEKIESVKNELKRYRALLQDNDNLSVLLQQSGELTRTNTSNPQAGNLNKEIRALLERMKEKEPALFEMQTTQLKSKITELEQELDKCIGSLERRKEIDRLFYDASVSFLGRRKRDVNDAENALSERRSRIASVLKKADKGAARLERANTLLNALSAQTDVSNENNNAALFEKATKVIKQHEQYEEVINHLKMGSQDRTNTNKRKLKEQLDALVTKEDALISYCHLRLRNLDKGSGTATEQKFDIVRQIDIALEKLYRKNCKEELINNTVENLKTDGIKIPEDANGPTSTIATAKNAYFYIKRRREFMDAAILDQDGEALNEFFEKPSEQIGTSDEKYKHRMMTLDMKHISQLAIAGSGRAQHYFKMLCREFRDICDYEDSVNSDNKEKNSSVADILPSIDNYVPQQNFENPNYTLPMPIVFWDVLKTQSDRGMNFYYDRLVRIFVAWESMRIEQRGGAWPHPLVAADLAHSSRLDASMQRPKIDDLTGEVMFRSQDDVSGLGSSTDRWEYVENDTDAARFSCVPWVQLHTLYGSPIVPVDAQGKLIRESKEPIKGEADNGKWQLEKTRSDVILDNFNAQMESERAKGKLAELDPVPWLQKRDVKSTTPVPDIAFLDKHAEQIKQINQIRMNAEKMADERDPYTPSNETMVQVPDVANGDGGLEWTNTFPSQEPEVRDFLLDKARQISSMFQYEMQKNNREQMTAIGVEISKQHEELTKINKLSDKGEDILQETRRGIRLGKTENVNVLSVSLRHKAALHRMLISAYEQDLARLDDMWRQSMHGNWGGGATADIGRYSEFGALLQVVATQKGGADMLGSADEGIAGLDYLHHNYETISLDDIEAKRLINAVNVWILHYYNFCIYQCRNMEDFKYRILPWLKSIHKYRVYEFPHIDWSREKEETKNEPPSALLSKLKTADQSVILSGPMMPLAVDMEWRIQHPNWFYGDPRWCSNEENPSDASSHTGPSPLTVTDPLLRQTAPPGLMRRLKPGLTLTPLGRMGGKRLKNEAPPRDLYTLDILANKPREFKRKTPTNSQDIIQQIINQDAYEVAGAVAKLVAEFATLQREFGDTVKAKIEQMPRNDGPISTFDKFDDGARHWKIARLHSQTDVWCQQTRSGVNPNTAGSSTVEVSTNEQFDEWKLGSTSLTPTSLIEKLTNAFDTLRPNYSLQVRMESADTAFSTIIYRHNPYRPYARLPGVERHREDGENPSTSASGNDSDDASASDDSADDVSDTSINIAPFFGAFDPGQIRLPHTAFGTPIVPVPFPMLV